MGEAVKKKHRASDAIAASARKKATSGQKKTEKPSDKPVMRKTDASASRTGAKKPGTTPKGASKRTRSGKRRTREKPVATAGARRSKFGDDADLFLGARAKRPANAKKKKRKGGRPPKAPAHPFGVLNACLAIGIAVLIALFVRQQRGYAEFERMRAVVDRQTFYAGTTVEGVDVSGMTLANALDYWGERVEARYAGRTVTLDNGDTVTAGELGYRSDYQSVLNAAWSAGRSGGLEERYRAAASRVNNPVAYAVTRQDYTPETLDAYVRSVAEKVDKKPVDASIDRFDTETFEFTFAEAQEGAKLDTDALKRDIARAIASGGGNVALSVSAVAPTFSTEDVATQYGLIDYAITNASSSSRARLNNIKLAMSMINGTRLAPGEEFSFNEAVGERTTARGFKRATAYSGGDVTEQVGGGICQVSTTLFNAAVKADMEILERHSHSLTVAYVDKGKDATVNWGDQDFRFRNTSPDDVYICCYLTDDKRVRFGIFGMLLPAGQKITLDAVTTEVVKYDTVYEASPLLAHGQTQVQSAGKNGYKAEAYKVRWDAEGNELSRELLCKSYYKMKSEVVLYGT